MSQTILYLHIFTQQQVLITFHKLIYNCFKKNIALIQIKNYVFLIFINLDYWNLNDTELLFSLQLEIASIFFIFIFAAQRMPSSVHLSDSMFSLLSM